jgi:hypothetical protein
VPFLLCQADGGPHFMGLQTNKGGETKSQHPKQHLGQGKRRNETTYRVRQKKLVSTKGYRQHEKTK